VLVMAGRGAGDGLSPPDSEAAGGPDWALLDAEDGDETTDYRRRCLLLEASLIKFKEKATRVRQLFTVKVKTFCMLFALYCGLVA